MVSSVSSQEPLETDTAANWPRFTLRYTFNPEELDAPVSFDPDELVVFDPSDGDDDAWVSATRGSYMDIKDAQ